MPEANKQIDSERKLKRLVRKKSERFTLAGSYLNQSTLKEQQDESLVPVKESKSASQKRETEKERFTGTWMGSKTI